MGAPVGNKNAAKSRRFEQALWREILYRDGNTEDGATLRKVAGVMLDAALGGDLQAIKELRDTLDGKPTQKIGGDEENPLMTVTKVQLVALASNDDSAGDS